MDKNLMLMKRYYGADIEITEMRKLFPWVRNFSLDYSEHDESLAMMHSSNQQQRHFVSFVQPNEFLLLISKMPNSMSHAWLLVVPSVNETQELLRWSRLFLSHRFLINLDSDVFIGIYDKMLQRYKVYEYFRICNSCEIQTSFVCTIHVNNELEGKNCYANKYQRRKNLNGTIIKGVGVNANEFDVDTVRLDNSSWILKGGAYAEVFGILSSELNFQYELTIFEGYRFGKYNRVNKSWDGIIGAVNRAEVDMSLNPLSMSMDRLEYVDFSMAVHSVGVRIYIQQTLEKNSVHWTFYTSPFSPLLHVAVLTCAIALALILWGFLVVRPPKERNFTLYETSWIILAAMCQRGSHMTPTSPSAKAIFLVAYFTCLIIYCGYSATLTSQLSVPQPLKLPFHDLRGLTQSHGWTGGPIKGDFTYIFMQKTCPDILAKSGNSSNSQCELLTQAWTKVVAPIEPTLPSNFVDGLRRVLTERFAFIATMTGARNIISTQLTDEEACRIHEMKGEPLSSNLAFALKKNLTIKKLINYKLLQMYESGTLNRIRLRWLPKRKTCSSTGNEVTDATLFDVAVAPILVLLGLFSSGLLLVVECWWGWRANSSSSSSVPSHTESTTRSKANSHFQLQPSSQAMNIGKDFYQTDNKMKWVFH